MTQEILDYLLIRSLLVNSSSDEIIEQVSDKESFSYFINNVSMLIEEEDFLILSPVLQDRVGDVLYKYRFTYNKEKEFNEQMNYIIGRLQDYHLMSDERKSFIIDSWVENESNVRELPKRYRNINDLLTLISLDTAYLIGITSMENIEVKSIIEYSSLINIIINKFPDVLENDKALLGVIRESILYLKKIPFLRREESKMLKNTLNKIDSNYELDQNLDIQMSLKLIKKTKK